jgi:hypothetical protein
MALDEKKIMQSARQINLFDTMKAPSHGTAKGRCTPPLSEASESIQPEPDPPQVASAVQI